MAGDSVGDWVPKRSLVHMTTIRCMAFRSSRGASTRPPHGDLRVHLIESDREGYDAASQAIRAWVEAFPQVARAVEGQLKPEALLAAVYATVSATRDVARGGDPVAREIYGELVSTAQEERGTSEHPESVLALFQAKCFGASFAMALEGFEDLSKTIADLFIKDAIAAEAEVQAASPKPKPPG